VTNVAYKHLEQRLKIGEFTLRQWAGFFFGALAAVAWGLYLSPFGATVSLVTAVYIGGIPIAAAYLAGATDFDLWLHLKSLGAYRRAVGRYVPGPGHTAKGYGLTGEARDDDTHADRVSSPDLDLESLWH
jgi:hypothetical protein